MRVVGLCALLTFFIFSFTLTSADTNNNNTVLSDRLLDLMIRRYTGNDVDDDRVSLGPSELNQLMNACQLGQHSSPRDSSPPHPSSSDIRPCVNSSQRQIVDDRTCNASTQCLNVEEILALAFPTRLPTSIDREGLRELCPLLLTQIEFQTCSPHRLSAKEITTKPTHLEVWGYGMLFVTVISLCSLVGVSVIPAIGKDLYDKLLTFLIGLAVGSLSGSAVFHLLPQAYGLLDNPQKNHDYLWVSLVVIGGIYLFFMTERFMKIFLDARKRKMQRLVRSCSDNEALRCMPSTISEEFRRSMGDIGSDPALKYISQLQTNDIHKDVKKNGSHSHEHHIEFKPGQNSAIATVAWMIIFGDGLHNFIDGLSIGAAFNKSILTGISISVAVICEEFPHELGDFAVLLKAGMSMKQAMMYNFLSACTCYMGLIVGILLGELETAGTYIFALAGGVFLYISLVDMIPELNEAVEVASKVNMRQAVHVLVLQNLGWFVGVMVLFILAYYNEEISFE